jgi:alpha-glucoside transport system substrate-binding protein
MTTRRIAQSILFPALALTAVLAGCGGGGAGKGATAGAQNLSGSVSVMGIWVGEEQKSFQAVIDDFRSRFPEVKVNYTPAGRADDRGPGRQPARCGGSRAAGARQ